MAAHHDTPDQSLGLITALAQREQELQSTVDGAGVEARQTVEAAHRAAEEAISQARSQCARLRDDHQKKIEQLKAVIHETMVAQAKAEVERIGKLAAANREKALKLLIGRVMEEQPR